MDGLLIFGDRTEFREWLKANGETSVGIWLVFGKTILKNFISGRSS